MIKVFIDGKEGTTGLRLYERIAQRNDIELTVLPDELRKDTAARSEAINSADVVFLCLPDQAAREAVVLCKNPNTIIIDTSTAHRTESGWTYAFPEISENLHRALTYSKRISVPGCHASGFIALIRPLIESEMLSKDSILSCTSITGYSGGGKKMIASYESQTREKSYSAPRQYALGQTHKHLPEMIKYTYLANEPLFMPIVADYYSGMAVSVPISSDLLLRGANIGDIKKLYKSRYCGNIVYYRDTADDDGMLSANVHAGRDSMEVSVFGNESRIILFARYDNLGKGASGAAIEAFNIAIGKPDEFGLEL